MNAGVPEKSSISNIADLAALADEKVYIDLGLGLSISGNTVQAQSAFNIAMPGLAYLGYGTNSNGIPNNVYTLMGKIADKLDSSDFSIEDVQPYLDAFNDSEQNVLTKITDIGAKSQSLDYIQTRLEDMEMNLNTKLDDVENISSIDAIIDYKMQQYAYTAALQIGSNILQPSFLDFMD